MPAAPRASFEDQGHFLFHSHRPNVPQCLVPSGALAPSAPSEEREPSEVDGFYERNVIFERLITGQQREDGVVPPAYCAAA